MSLPMYYYNCKCKVRMLSQLGLDELKTYKAQEELAKEEGERFCPDNSIYQT
jgi:hypothetical protein